VATTIPAAALTTLLTAATTLSGAESAATAAIRAVGFERLAETVKAYNGLGDALKPVVKAMGEDFADVGASAVLTYLQANVSEADWGSLPTSGSTYVKALQVARWHTAAKLTAYGKLDMSPDVDVYGPWLQVNATGKFGNRSKYDVQASLVDPSDWDATANDGKGAAKPGAKFGTLVLKSVGKGSGDGNGAAKLTTPKAIADVLKMDAAALAAVKVVANITLPADVDAEAFVCQVLAQYLAKVRTVAVAAVTAVTAA